MRQQETQGTASGPPSPKMASFEDLLVRALSRTFKPLVLVGLLALIGGIATELPRSGLPIVLLYSTVFCCAAVAALGKNFGYRARIGLLITALYALAMSELVRFGTDSMAYMLFLMITVLAAIYLPSRTRTALMIAVGLSIAIVACLYLYRYIPKTHALQASSYNLIHWLTGPITLLVMCLVAVTLIGEVVQTLRKNMEDSAALVARLNAQVEERTRAEEALRQGESELWQVIDLVPHSIYAKDENGRFIFVNRRSAQLMGTTPQEAVGKTQHELTRVQSEADELAAEDKEVLERNTAIFRREHVFTDSAGLRHTEEISKMPFVTGRTKGPAVLGISLDITERKMAEEKLRRSEEHFRSLVENVSEIILVVDTRGVLCYASPAIKRVLGYEVNAVEGFPALNRVHPDDRDTVRAMTRLAQSELGRTFNFECRVQDACGAWVEIEGEGKAAADPEGQIRTIVTCRDIRERKQGESERERLETQLRQSQKMEAVGQLAGGIAHDFNNLLQAILGYTDLVLAKLDPEAEYWTDLLQIRQAGEKARDVTRQLLTFSRRQVIQLAPIDLNEVVAGVMKILRRIIGEHIQLEINQGHSLGTIQADQGQIEQVLMNLCVNARDAMPSGGTLSIRTGMVEAGREWQRTYPWAHGGVYALLSVTDTGCGMDKETLDRIFEPFFTTKGVGEGTGLGLSTVYGIVQQHGGMVHVYSEVGQGTTFKVYLPSIGPTAVPVQEETVVESPSGGVETILLAEDEPSILELVAQVLGEAGYTVITAADGEAAVRLFEARRDQIDLAFLDVVMPRLSGREVHRYIIEKQPDMRFLFSSGYDMGAIHTNFVLNEGMHLIQKPYNLDTLLRTVRQVLDGR